tara:strand:- start:49 stop:447 length:399 start_codon:yes stop_codon:yes gene_type:complete
MAWWDNNDKPQGIPLEVIDQKIEDLKPLIHKMEKAIEKLSELNTSVSRMLAVHEERITKQEEIDTVLFTKIDQLRDKMDLDHNSVLSRIQSLDKKIWIAIGSIAVITFIIAETPILQTLTQPLDSSIIEKTD